jgi:hypothetical protein
VNEFGTQTAGPATLARPAMTRDARQGTMRFAVEEFAAE